MTTGSAPSASSSQQKGFECPWCGAISPVSGQRLGEHFACPECSKATKLTDKNTSTWPPPAVAPDAPHLSGDRTFDCPWCGAISAVPSSHLGERFQCTECGKATRLTAANTRRAPITAPPPDAPPPAPSGAGRGALVVVAVLLVGGAVAWAVASGSGEGATGGDKAAGSGSNGTVTPTTAAGGPAMDGAEAGMTSPPAPPPTPPGPSPTAPGMEAVVPPVEDAAAVERRAELAAAHATLVTAQAAADGAARAFEAADAKVKAWTVLDPVAAEAAAVAPALDEVTAEVKRLLAAKVPVADPATATPEQARAFDQAVVAFATASPARMRAMERVLAFLAGERAGRAVAGLSWQGLDFRGPAFARGSAAVAEACGAALSRVPKDLAEARRAAQDKREVATRILVQWAARVRALEAAAPK